ncbi:MAG: hypothetical protein GX130_06800 [Candidatus Hydrogenedens sp.]|jgi:hypothetical protein|nr:hypothetical protein [Candidatus Hydrogenedens sp.]
MKKMTMVMVAMAMVAGIAFASSLSIPWFVDNAPVGASWPPYQGMMTLVYLKSNVDEVLTCEITYYSEDGIKLGPEYPDNTFTINPMSSVAFRPVAEDPLMDLGGHDDGIEGAQGVAVPDRPRDEDPKKNGSATISWTGGPNDVQGMVATTSGAFSYAHLLPPGN